MADQENPKRVFVLHECDHHMVVGDANGDIKVASPMKEGEPINPDESLVQFTEVEGEPRLRDMHVTRISSGPSKASTPKYRSGWDTVFKKTKKKEELN